jgi:hypothetical protein
MRALFIALCVFATVSAAQAQGSAQEPSKETLKPGDTITGKLRRVEARHPNGTLLHAFQVVVDTPKAFAKEDEFCDGPPKTFHLVVMNDKPKEARLKKLLGKKVAVVAEDLMCSETAWHIGDAVLFQWHLVEPPAR